MTYEGVHNHAMPNAMIDKASHRRAMALHGAAARSHNQLVQRTMQAAAAAVAASPHEDAEAAEAALVLAATLVTNGNGGVRGKVKPGGEDERSQAVQSPRSRGARKPALPPPGPLDPVGLELATRPETLLRDTLAVLSSGQGE